MSRNKNRKRNHNDDADPSRGAIHKIVVGQLRSTIKAHGPITSVLIGSAAKRVVGALVGHLSVAHEGAKFLEARCSERDAIIGVLRSRVAELLEDSIQQPKPPERPRRRGRTRRHRRQRAANVRLPELGMAQPGEIQPGAPLGQA